MRLMALMPFVYASRPLRAGDVFEASEKDATLLKVVKRAVDAPSRLFRTRDVEAEPDATVVQPRVKRQYRRRDLSAEP